MSEVVHYVAIGREWVAVCDGSKNAGSHWRKFADGSECHDDQYMVTCPACLVWLAIDCLERAAKVEPERARTRVDEVMDAAMGIRERAA